jgi:hypothetical protein
MSLRCKACQKEIAFLLTDTGRMIPVDKESTDAADEYFDRERHVTHFRTCPAAGEFRRKAH